MFPGHSGESRDSGAKVKYGFLALLLAVSPLYAEPTVLDTVPLSNLTPTCQDKIVGKGTEVVLGKLVTVYYEGKFPNGHVFDREYVRHPFTFVEGVTRLLPGWTTGVAGMRPGGRRIVTIPPALAYGVNGVRGFIPSDATLVYEIEVVTVE